MQDSTRLSVMTDSIGLELVLIEPSTFVTVDNNAISSSIEQSTFFLNKSFHSHISFDSNSIEYEIIRARIEAGKAKNIFEHMK